MLRSILSLVLFPRIWGYSMAFTKFLTNIFMVRWHSCRCGKEGHIGQKDMEYSVWLEAHNQLHRKSPHQRTHGASAEAQSSQLWGSQAGVSQGLVTYPDPLTVILQSCTTSPQGVLGGTGAHHASSSLYGFHWNSGHQAFMSSVFHPLSRLSCQHVLILLCGHVSGLRFCK